MPPRGSEHSVDVLVRDPESVVDFTWVQEADHRVTLEFAYPLPRSAEDRARNAEPATTIALLLRGDARMFIPGDEADVSHLPKSPGCSPLQNECLPADFVVLESPPTESSLHVFIGGSLDANLDGTSGGSTVLRTPEVHSGPTDARIPAGWYKPGTGSRVAVSIVPAASHELVQAFPTDQQSGYEQRSWVNGSQSVRWAANLEETTFIQPGYVRYEDPAGKAKAQRDVLLSGVGLGVASALVLELVFWFVRWMLDGGRGGLSRARSLAITGSGVSTSSTPRGAKVRRRSRDLSPKPMRAPKKRSSSTSRAEEPQHSSHAGRDA